MIENVGQHALGNLGQSSNGEICVEIEIIFLILEYTFLIEISVLVIFFIMLF